MSAELSPQIRKTTLSLALALAIVLLLWLVYTILYTRHPGDTAAALLEFIPGILAVLVLLAAGFKLSDCFLRPAPLSRPGLLFLGLSFLLMPIMWLTGRWVGWHPLDALLYAPASGISQELFFRCALLPVMLAVFKHKPMAAILVQAGLFALWHVPLGYLNAPLPGLIGIVIVTFLCGILWAKQVQHDGTVFWMMAFHSIILVINTFFTWE